MENDGVKLCPRCGGEGKVVYDAPYWFVYCAVVECVRCTDCYPSEEEAVAEWNRRGSGGPA